MHYISVFAHTTRTEYGKKLDFIPSESDAEIQRFMESIVTMRDMLGRDHMKVAFFGRCVDKSVD